MLTKGIVGLAALIAGGFVTIDTVVVDRVKATSERIAVVPQSDAAGGANYKALRERANSAVNILLEREKAAQRGQIDAAGRPRCSEQAWPYYSADCLVAENGAAVRRTIRTVGIENHTEILQRASF